MMRGVHLVACCVACAALGCGGGQTRIGDLFNTQWQDDGGRSISAVQGKLSGHAIPRGANVAVGVVDRGLVGVVLDTGKTWTFLKAVDVRPWIAGDVVVVTAGGKLFALEASSGRQLWSLPVAGKVRGAGDDGRTTLVSLEPSAGVPGKLIAVERDGKVTREMEVTVPVGSPTLVANHAFIPWQNQYVSVVDLGSGDEVARVVLRHLTTQAFLAGGALFFGEAGITRFDERIGAASRDGASKAVLPDRELPGKPRWLRAGGIAGKVTSDAFDRNRIYAMPAARGDGLGFDAGRYYATYFRIVVGLQEETGELAWARRLDTDALGGAAYEGGVALCERTGRVGFYEAGTGAAAGEVSLGTAVRACVVQADRLTRTAEPRPEPVVEQLAKVIDVSETDMVMMHAFLLRELIAQASPRATERLIELAFDARTPPDLMTEVRKGLASRRNGAEHMLEALGRRYDFLAGVLMTPPVGPLADALAAMKETRAAPLLAEHLNDPANSTEDVKRAALALETLATQGEREPLELFFSLYRATAHNEDLIQALVAVARAILRVGGNEGRELVRAAAYDLMTVPSLQQPLRDLVSGAEKPRTKGP